MGEGLGVGGLRVCVCVCVCVPTVHIFACVHMHICGSRRRTSGCAHQMIQHFMDKIHVLWVWAPINYMAWLFCCCSTAPFFLSPVLSFSLSLFTHSHTPSFVHSHSFTFFSLCPLLLFLLRTECHQNLSCQYILRCRMPLCKCCQKTITLGRSA